jgi:hypothetical protein
MKTFIYTTDEVTPEKLELSLDEFGKNGWEFIRLIVMQKQVPDLGAKLMGQAGYHMEIKFKLIFKKEVIELKN